MQRFVSYDPTTGQPIGSYPITSENEVACTIDTARQASNVWRQSDVTQRCSKLNRLHALIAAEADALAADIAREIGKPLQDALGAEILPCLRALKWLVSHAPNLLKQRRVAGSRQSAMSPEPYGVVGVIGTWNYPLLLDLLPIAWALAAGNVVVWKPSELATTTAATLYRLLAQAGLPVFLIMGDGSTGRSLCRLHCDKIAFTGGIATGRAILKELAAFGTPSVMELSGNDAMIVCADADIDLAARSAVWARCCNAGQSCVAPQRIYVAAEAYETFLQRCRVAMEQLRPSIDYGPMRTVTLRHRAHELIWATIPHGARLLMGGYPLVDRPGFYYAPTLLADCDDAMPVFTDDFFGPVVCVSPFKNEAEAIERANQNAMALGAGIWTRHRGRGKAIATELRVGIVAINQDTLLVAADPNVPFGGLRASGYGKQRGAEGLYEFVQWKVTTCRKMDGARRHLFPYCEATIPILRGIIAVQSAHNPIFRLRAAIKLVRAAMSWQKNALNSVQENPIIESAIKESVSCNAIPIETNRETTKQNTDRKI